MGASALSDIFLSYVREDLERARTLAEALGAEGWSVWWDRRAHAGSRIHKIIGRQLTDARCVIVLWSERSVESDWVIDEANEAKKHEKYIPASLDRTEPPLGFRGILVRDLSLWPGGEPDANVHLLVADIEAMIGPPAPKVEEARKKAEEETARTEAEAKARRKAEEEEARREAEAEAKRRAVDEEARKRTEEKRKAKAAAAQKKAEEETRRKAEEEELRKKTEEEAKRKSEEQEERRKTEVKRKAEEEKREADEEAARKQVEAKLKAEAEEAERPAEVQQKPETPEPPPGAKKWIAVAAVLILVVSGIGVYQALKPASTSTRTPVQPLQTTATAGPSPGQTFRDCDVCPEMVVVPAGSFTMGSTAAQRRTAVALGETEEWLEDEGPVPYTVRIAAPFAVGKYEVTFAEWDACVADGGCDGYRPNAEGWGRVWQPVINVSWNDAQSYVKWLSQKTGKAYRLLTEAEWEYAARAGTTTLFWWGDGIGRNNANCNGCGSKWDGEQTAPIGSFRANDFGLYDVHGNVWEWVADCYEEDAYKIHKDYPSMVGDLRDSCRRVLRGGSWFIGPWNLRSANRFRDFTEFRNNFLGFRVARTF